MKLIALLIPLAVHSSAWSQAQQIRSSDPAMTAAIAKAKQSVDEFLKTKERRPPGALGFTVKVLFVEGSTKEHMWVGPFRSASSGAGYEGILQNEPMSLQTLRRGSQVSFSKEQVTDWGYEVGGKAKGYFTICVLIAKNPNLRASYEEQAGLRYECAL